MTTVTAHAALAAALAALALGGCPAPEPEPEPETPPQADLSAFERRRAASAGAGVEAEAMAARAAGARPVYAAKTDEPSLIDLQVEGKAPPVLDPEGEARRAAGAAAPSDLDRASEEIGPWIDMDLVGRAIRGQHRSLKTCWDAEGIVGGDRRVDLRLTVDDRGTAREVAIAGSSPVRDDSLERCLAGVLSKTDFPEARNGDKTFTYIVRF